MSQPPNPEAAGSPTNITEEGQKQKTFTIKFRRPRGSRACFVCRNRKVRCDAEIHIPCTNCITFGCECKLPEPKKRRSTTADTRPAKKQQPHDISTRQNAVNEPVANISSTNVLSNVRKLPERAKPKLVRFLGSTSSCGLIIMSGGESHCPYPERYMAMSNDDMAIDAVEFEILKLRGAFLLPPKELCLEILDSYFEHVHPLLPILNRTDFMKRFNDPENQPSLMVLQAVLLSGSRVCKSPKLSDSKNSTKLATTTFYKRAKALYEAGYETDPISIIQTLLLLSWYWEGPDDVTKNSFYWTRTAITIAQGFGFQRDVRGSPDLSENEKKLWRRIWWCLFERDRTVAVSFGRPIVIDVNDCDVSVLTMDDFVESEPGEESPYKSNELHALYFIHMVKLAEVTGIILKEQYSVRAQSVGLNTRKLIIEQCDMLMGIWFNNLPSSLIFSLNDPSTHNFYSCVLNTQYYIRLYLVHRSNLLKMIACEPKGSKIYPSWGISFKSAYMISVIGKSLLHNNDVQYTPANVVYVYMTTLVMSVYYVDSPNIHVATSAYEIMNICQEVLKESSKVWPVANIGLEYFEKFANDKVKRQRIVAKIEKHNEEELAKAKAGDDTTDYDRVMNAKLHATVTFSSTEKDLNQHASNSPNFRSSIADLLNNGPIADEQDKVQEDVQDIKQQQYQQHNQYQQASNPTPPSLTHQGLQQHNSIIQGYDVNFAPSEMIASTSGKSQNNNLPFLNLVTENLTAVNSNFYENFDPAQLFPDLPLTTYQNPNIGISYAPTNLTNNSSSYNFFSPTFNNDQYNYDSQAVANEDFRNAFGMTN